VSAAGRYSEIVARKPDEPGQQATLALLDAQTCIVESIENLVRSGRVEYDEVDGRLGDAMRKLASARSAIQEMKRKKLGLVTIAETA
jgi:hypothetical protein